MASFHLFRADCIGNRKNCLYPHAVEVTDGATMANAIRLGRYFLQHAMAAYDALPEKALTAQANLILEMIRDERLKVFDRRTAMRYCRSFKTTAEIQPVLDFLEDYGYIAQMNAGFRPAGRPPLPRYAVNPKVTEGFCHTVPVLSGKGGTGESVDL